MRHEHLRPDFRRNQPVAGQGNSRNLLYLLTLRFLPAFKIDRSGKWRKHQELSEGQSGSLRELKSGVEGLFAIAREPEDERAQDVHSMFTKSLQALDEIFSGAVEVLINRFQSFGGHRLDSNQRSFDIGFAHGHQKLRIFCRFHGDLGKKVQVCGQIGQPGHKLESLVAQRL